MLPPGRRKFAVPDLRCWPKHLREEQMSDVNDRAGFELGCKLFYLAHWFNLNSAELGALLENAPVCTLGQLLELVFVLQEANPDEHNASVEEWCRTAQEELHGLTPCDAVKRGEPGRVVALVRKLGKLPSVDDNCVTDEM